MIDLNAATEWMKCSPIFGASGRIAPVVDEAAAYQAYSVGLGLEATTDGFKAWLARKACRGCVACAMALTGLPEGRFFCGPVDPICANRGDWRRARRAIGTPP